MRSASMKDDSQLMLSIKVSVRLFSSYQNDAGISKSVSWATMLCSFAPGEKTTTKDCKLKATSDTLDRAQRSSTDRKKIELLIWWLCCRKKNQVQSELKKRTEWCEITYFLVAAHTALSLQCCQTQSNVRSQAFNNNNNILNGGF